MTFFKSLGEEMGEIRVILEIENTGDRYLCQKNFIQENQVRKIVIDALVDTGAVMLLLPQDRVEELGLEKGDKVIVTLANEQKIELDMAHTLTIKIGNRSMRTDCLVGPPQCEALVGQLILERLDLIIDPVKQTLTPRPESPYLPSLKLK
jgi:clan AA aspartic protease